MNRKGVMSDSETRGTEGIPKADLHMHAETRPRLDRLVSRHTGEAAHDWAEELRGLADVPPGMKRLEQAFSALAGKLDIERLDALNQDDAVCVEWMAEALLEAAADGAVLVEVRFGAKRGMRSGFMSLFREAEGRVRETYPEFHAEALTTGLWPSRDGASEAFEDSLRAATRDSKILTDILAEVANRRTISGPVGEHEIEESMLQIAYLDWIRRPVGSGVVKWRRVGLACDESCLLGVVDPSSCRLRRGDARCEDDAYSQYRDRPDQHSRSPTFRHPTPGRSAAPNRANC